MKYKIRYLISLLIFTQLSLQFIQAQEYDDIYYTPENKKKSLKTDTVHRVSKNYHAALLFDPSGFITMGPALFFEPALGKNFSANVGIRLHNLGLIQSSLFGEMDLSYMVHTSVRCYINPKQKIRGFFLGPGFEYGRSNYESGNVYKARAYGGELGYKWIFRNGFCFEIADMVGYTQSKKIEDTSGEFVEDVWTTDMFVLYMLSLKIGITF
ncbi:MAG: hypothetical protein JXJ22_15695 [Bacteroidales bacterium]|nr:hypothetical protein [Bacteroidales bacterium]